MSEPYSHIGINHEDERPGLTCDECQYELAVKQQAIEDNFQEHWSGVMFTSVPGGATVALPGGKRGPGKTRREHIKEFEGGLEDYANNKKAGLVSGTKKGSVKKAYEKAERNERLRKKHESGQLHDRGIELAPALTKQIGAK